MITGLNPEDIIDYIVPGDDVNPTIWKLGVIPSFLMARMNKGDEMEAAYSLLQYGLKGWDNFTYPYKTEKRSVMGMEYQVVPLELLGKIDLGTIGKLTQRLVEINTLTGAETKN